jgi:hypothetical protein
MTFLNERWTVPLWFQGDVTDEPTYDGHWTQQFQFPAQRGRLLGIGAAIECEEHEIIMAMVQQ